MSNSIKTLASAAVFTAVVIYVATHPQFMSSAKAFFSNGRSETSVSTQTSMNNSASGTTALMNASSMRQASAAQQAPSSQPVTFGVERLQRGMDGHYSANIVIKGAQIPVMVDTGASMLALTYEDALRAGIYLQDKDFTGKSSTANGVGRYAPIMIDVVRLGSLSVRNVPGAVMPRGSLNVTLLGMGFLNKLRSFEASPDGNLVLKQ